MTKQQKIKLAILAVILIFGIVQAIILAGKGDNGKEEAGQTTSALVDGTTDSPTDTPTDAPTTDAGKSDMKVTFIDVGQADCVLIESAGKFMIVDAGNNDDGTMVVNYLKSEGVTRLEYVIGTHPHEDHIGGLDNVIKAFEVGKVIMPDKSQATSTYEGVLKAIQKKKLTITLPVPGDVYTLGNASFTIIGPVKDYGDEINNWSIGLRLVNGNDSFMLCADAEMAAEIDMVNSGATMKSDVLKVNHHGSKDSTSYEFLNAVDPDYAVIMVGVDNEYGYPKDRVLERLAEKNAIVYRTDLHGHITAISSGDGITFSLQKQGQ
ncbi:MAG: MBL fold metallo-hydrolase [Lachnospiraceae bacterium]|nr:MBL fold metallo-hydrolase [Lachnospira sp.]MBR6697030.1 MBL fold metallo-hydrolase [Lachnospiraceae bacterium]